MAEHGGFIDLGRKVTEGIAEVPRKSEKERITYPSFHIEKDEPPGFKVGQDLEAKVKLKLVGVSKRAYDGGRYSCEFEVHAIDLGHRPSKREDEGSETQNAIEEGLEEKKREKEANPGKKAKAAS